MGLEPQPSPLPGYSWYAPKATPTATWDHDWNLWGHGVVLVWVQAAGEDWALFGWDHNYADPESLRKAAEHFRPPATFPTAQAAIDWVNFALEMES